jgi:hypothetical protein
VSLRAVPVIVPAEIEPAATMQTANASSAIRKVRIVTIGHPPYTVPAGSARSAVDRSRSAALGRRARHVAYAVTTDLYSVVMNEYATASGTIVVHVGQATKLELAERARENDRTLSAEVRRGLREYLERDDEKEER